MATKKVATSLDLFLNELKNFKVDSLESAPETVTAGRMYFNTAKNTLYYGAGNKWNPISTGVSVDEALKSLKLYYYSQNGKEYKMYLYTGDKPIGSNLFGEVDVTDFLKNASVSEVIRFTGKTTSGVGTYNSATKTYTTANGRTFEGIESEKEYLGIVVDNYSTGGFSEAISGRYKTFAIPLDTQDGFSTIVIDDSVTIAAKDRDYKLALNSSSSINWEYTDGELVATVNEVASDNIDGLKFEIDIDNNLILKSQSDKSLASVSLSRFAIDGMQEGAVLITANGTSEKVTVGGSEYTVDGLTIGKTYIVFVWNTASGKQPMALDVTTLIDVYTANDGIELSGKQFSIKRDPNSEGFLTVSANGLKVSGVQQAINDSKTSVIGKSGDASTVNTIFGAKAYADSVAREAQGYNLTKTVSTGDSTALWANHTNPNATADETGYKVDKGSIVVLWQLEEIDVQITHNASSPVTVSWSGITPSPQSPLVIEYRVIAK